MRLVIKYYVTDECTYSCDVTEPIEYDSAEAFAVDFEKEVLRRSSEGGWEFELAGKSWDVNAFYYQNFYAKDGAKYHAPNILTVDEWFEQYGKD